MYQMKSAIEAKDADRFSKHVDFPALRESFKSQLIAVMDRKIDASDKPANPFAKLGQALAGAELIPYEEPVLHPSEDLRMRKSGIVKTS
jgi:hypothetical protein